MAEPYARPPIGSRPRLYRLLRDTLYHSAGTILCLNEDQVSGAHHEPVVLPSDDADKVATLEAEITDLKANGVAVATLQAQVDEMKGAVASVPALHAQVEQLKAAATDAASLRAEVEHLKEMAATPPPPPPPPPAVTVEPTDQGAAH